MPKRPRKTKGDESEQIDVGDDEESDGARWPSDQPPLPKPPKRNDPETAELRKAADLMGFEVSERLQGHDSADQFLSAVLPVRRKTRDSAVFQTSGGDK